MRSVAANADSATQTCEIRLKEPGLPDLGALKRHLEQTMRVGGTLRGVEVTVVGRLSHRGDGLYLEISRTQDSVRLAPLRHKVQWDWANKREHESTPAERDAYNRLFARGEGEPVTVTGPLTQAPDGGLFTLEVRIHSTPSDTGHNKDTQR